MPATADDAPAYASATVVFVGRVLTNSDLQLLRSTLLTLFRRLRQFSFMDMQHVVCVFGRLRRADSKSTVTATQVYVSRAQVEEAQRQLDAFIDSGEWLAALQASSPNFGGVTATRVDSQNSSNQRQSNSRLVGGIAAGCIAGVAIICFIAYVVHRKRGSRSGATTLQGSRMDGHPHTFENPIYDTRPGSAVTTPLPEPIYEVADVDQRRESEA